MNFVRITPIDPNASKEALDAAKQLETQVNAAMMHQYESMLKEFIQKLRFEPPNNEIYGRGEL